MGLAEVRAMTDDDREAYEQRLGGYGALVTLSPEEMQARQRERAEAEEHTTVWRKQRHEVDEGDPRLLEWLDKVRDAKVGDRIPAPPAELLRIGDSEATTSVTLHVRTSHGPPSWWQRIVAAFRGALRGWRNG